jgi:hypothetical protein
MKKNYMNFKRKLFALSSGLCLLGLADAQAQGVEKPKVADVICPTNIEITGSQYLCSEYANGGNSRLTVSVDQGNAAFTWRNDFGSDISNSNEFNVTEPGIYHAYAYIEGCDDFSASVTVFESTNPQISIQGDLGYCAGTSGSSLQASGSGVNIVNTIWNGGSNANTNNASTQNLLAGEYTVSLETGEGCVFSQYVSVYQNSLPGNYSGQAICLGRTLNIQDNNDLEQTGNAGVTYQIYNNSLIIEANKVSDNLTLNNTQPIDYYIVKTQNGCEDVQYFAVEYYTAPSTPNLVNTTERCGPGEVTFINNDGFGAFKIYNAQSGGDLITDGLTIGNVQQNETYYISSIDDNTCESERIEVTATIKDLPYIGIIDNVEVCTGGTVTLIENSILRNSKVNAVASFAIYSDQELQNLESNDLTLTNVNNFGSYYVVKTENGCSAPTFTVQVNERYLYIYATQDFPLCDQSDAGISSYSDFEDLNPTYNWYKNNSPYQSNTSYINTSQAGTYKVVATIPGCNSVNDQVTISKAASISTDITGDLTFCAGGSTTLNAANIQSYSYDWYDGDRTISTTSTVQVFRGGNLRLTIADGSTGCQSETSVDLTATEVNFGNFTSDAVCQGGDITFTENLNNRLSKTNSVPTYAIYANPLMENLVSDNLTLTNVQASGMYYIVKTENGCNSPVIQVSTTVNEVPVFTYIKDGSFITANITSASEISSFGLLDCGGPYDVSSNTNTIRIPSSSSYMLSVNTINGCNFTTECIEAKILAGDINGNGIIENDRAEDVTRIKTPPVNEIAGDVDLDGIINGSEIIGDLSGNYIIDGNEIEGDYNGNMRIDASENVVTSVSANKLSTFTAYPNPASDVINVSFQVATSGNVSVVNANGIEVSNQSINGTLVSVNTSSLTSGVYILKVNSNNGFATQQIVIAK